MQRNLLLASLTDADRERIGPFLREVSIAGGAPLDRAIVPDHAVFPQTLVASVGEHLAGVGSVDTGMIGCEGLIGWQTVMGEGETAHTGVAQLAGGTGLAIPKEALVRLCHDSRALHDALLRFAHNFTVQLGHTIVANLRDGIDRRLARWLLMLHDRVVGDELTVTHIELATALAVRRASITDTLHVLEGERVVRCTRGRILIRDRALLRACAGGSYGAAEARYTDAIAPFGKG